MNAVFSPRQRHEFNKFWKKAIAENGYQIPETKDDFKILGPFPFFQLNHLMVYAKDHTQKTINKLTTLIHEIVGTDFFSRNTVSEALRSEIKTFLSDSVNKTSEWHLDNIVKNISLKNRKRLTAYVVSGLQLENIGLINSGNWKLLLFDEKEIKDIVENESGSKKWVSDLEKYLNSKFRDKYCILIETKGDLDSARRKAHYLASYIINTLRYFICNHIAHTGKAQDVGISLDFSNQEGWLNAFSTDLEIRATTMISSGGRHRSEYTLTDCNLEIIKDNCHAESLWSLIHKKELTDLERSIITSITWLGDAQQENDLNAAYVKYWIAIEALITGHRGGTIENRLKEMIVIMIKEMNGNVPSKTQVAKAYELRCKIVHSGHNDIVSIEMLNKVCLWATQCLFLCIYLRENGYISREQIEHQSIKEKT